MRSDINGRRRSSLVWPGAFNYNATAIPNSQANTPTQKRKQQQCKLDGQAQHRVCVWLTSCIDMPSARVQLHIRICTAPSRVAEVQLCMTGSLQAKLL